ncbi:MAG: MazG nucleotide pyrophosphohydrolase domain-containing protein [Trueperaceae bacterium]
MERVLDTLRALRAPDGCPWDRAQTHDSLRPHLLEEAAEAVDALASGRDRDVIDELGDVLLQVAFHAVLAEEDERWGYDDVQEALVAKLIRRHPHVFGDDRADGPAVDDPAAVEASWARIKAQERAERPAASPSERVPRSLPALARAAAVAKAADWCEPTDAVRRAADPDRTEPELLAEALLALAVRARRAGHDPELLLRDRLDAGGAAGSMPDGAADGAADRAGAGS